MQLPHDSYLVDPASSHMLVSKTKPCLSQRLSHACLSITHHCGGPVKLMQDSLSARKDLESSSPHCVGPVKLAQACLSVSKELHVSHIFES